MKLRHMIFAFVLTALMTGICLTPARSTWAGAATTTPVLETPATEKADTEENLGFPQLKTDTYASQVFWLFISFALLYPLMAWLALPGVGRVLDERKRRHEEDLSRAEMLNGKAEKTKAEYEKSLAKAQRTAAEALSTAERAISEKASEAQSRFAAETRRRMAEADQVIARAKTEALQSLADISAEVAANMVQKVAGVQVNTAEAKKAVERALAEKKGAA